MTAKRIESPRDMVIKEQTLKIFPPESVVGYMNGQSWKLPLKHVFQILHRNHRVYIPYHKLRLKQEDDLSTQEKKQTFIKQIQGQIVLRLFLLAGYGETEYTNVLSKLEHKSKKRRKKLNKTSDDNDQVKFWIKNITAFISLASFLLPPAADMAEFVLVTLEYLPTKQSRKLAAGWENELLDYMEIRPSEASNARNNKPISPSPALIQRKEKQTKKKKVVASSMKSKHDKMKASTLLSPSSRNKTIGVPKSRLHSQRTKILVPQKIAHGKTLSNNRVALPSLNETKKRATTTTTMCFTVNTTVVQETPPSKQPKASHVVQETPEMPSKRVLWSTQRLI